MDLAARIEAFRSLLAQEPADPLLRMGLGLALLESGDAEGARAELAEAVRLKPDYAAAYREWGRALEGAGRPGEAAEVWARGAEVARATGDLQAGREMEVFLKRLAR
ncbi:MAG TPA: tetratricopeptide repeat protein [Planctomycetota bacterium]|nr:tetratricopeptide repeat protein [Planctomycetota bacterium]